MAVFFTDSDTDPAVTGIEEIFPTLWRHYEDSRFLYTTKLKRLAPVLGHIQEQWPLLLAAPADLVQVHAARDQNNIVCSATLFRDTRRTFVAQHAVSHGRPAKMIDCLVSTVSGASASDAEFMAMFFRMENKWPTELVNRFRDAHAASNVDLSTRRYLSATLAGFEAREASTPLDSTSSRTVWEISSVVLGPLRALASDIEPTSFDLAISQRYREVGLVRTRDVYGVSRDGRLAGIVLCYHAGIPMNLSLLCSRAELLVHPEAPDRDGVVRDLCVCALTGAAKRGQPILTILADHVDAPAATQAGFIDSGRSYSSFFWRRDSGRGFAAAIIALAHWYSEARV